MSTLSRRHFFASATPAFLAGYAMLPPHPRATSLEMARLYATDLTDAFTEAWQVYMTGPGQPPKEHAALVKGLLQSMRDTIDILDDAPSATDARASSRAIISAAQQLSPPLTPMLGPVALYIPLALSVLQAFADAVPPPPSAPMTPPMLLHKMALRYRSMIA